MIKTHVLENCRIHLGYKLSAIVNGITITGTIGSVYEDIITLENASLSTGADVKHFNNYNVDVDQVAGWTIMEKESTFDNLKQLR